VSPGGVEEGQSTCHSRFAYSAFSRYCKLHLKLPPRQPCIVDTNRNASCRGHFLVTFNQSVGFLNHSQPVHW
jgi:hypothetical protein